MGYKKNIAEVLGATFLPEIFELFQTTPRIVFYHGITNEHLLDTSVQANQIAFDVFKEQINYLNKYYTIISLEEMIYSIKNRKYKKDYIAITFDDGYANNYSIVAPYLMDLHIPFAVFICPRLIQDSIRIPTYYIRAIIKYSRCLFIDIPCLKKKYFLLNLKMKEKAISEIICIFKKSNKILSDLILNEIMQNISMEDLFDVNEKFKSEELMTWSMIQELKDNGIIIGSHTLDHTILHENQSLEEIDRQLIESQKTIKEHLGACEYFAFPNGALSYISNYSIILSKKVYKSSFIVDGKSVSAKGDSALISRIGVSDSLDSFKFQLSILSASLR
jgi:peptidoglycan/xylan/chitin deacetylase (PgdA/CDA1 family)